MNFGLLRHGVLLGLGAAAPIGPVNVEIARRTLRAGFRHGFALGCGAVSVDVFYAVLSSLSLGAFLQRPAVLGPVRVAAVVLLLYLSFLCFRGARRTWRARGDALTSDAPPSTARRPSLRGAYLTGVLMTLLNPMTVVFWFVGVPGTVGSITQDPRGDLPMICAGVFIGTLGWVVAFAGLLSFAGRYRRNSWLVAADLLGGVTLLCFALASLWSYLDQAL